MFILNKSNCHPVKLLLWLSSFLTLFGICHASLQKTDKIENGAIFHGESGIVKVEFVADGQIRVQKWLPESSDVKESLIVLDKERQVSSVELIEKKELVILEGSALTVEFDRKQETLRFLDANGEVYLQEAGYSIELAEVPFEERAYNIKQAFVPNDSEGLYGLGQHQNGVMNYLGHKALLSQSNTDAMASFLISNHRFGILWDNTSLTRFDGTGEYYSLWSEVADNIDYYFVAGKSMDDVISEYRDLTGHAPMYGKWCYGYWQSKEHYATQDEVLNIAREYREREIPIDTIIQDWNYWGEMNKWSGMIFDETRFPDAKGMVESLHDDNFHIIISIWPGLGPDTDIHKEMAEKGFLYDKVGWAGFKYYDAFNPEANDIYWKHLQKELYAADIDGWWIDSTEPDVVNALTQESQAHEMRNLGTNHLGSWSRYLNAFSLKMTDDLYANLREKTEDERVYILTRSTFSGQQRSGSTTWSGDIGASWDQYRKQITAGVNHCMAGIPYWTFDIGSFVIGSYDGVFCNGGKDPAYQELYTRMFQLGTFSPIFRSHGSETPREIWEFGEYTDTLIKFDNLRYRLLPTIYSMAWKVTNEGYTLMRGLAMDFPEDEKILDIKDQFMFGSSMLVCPVVEYQEHRPPEPSVLIDADYYQSAGGEGIEMTVYDNADFTNPIHSEVSENTNLDWYTGWPEYMKDPEFSIRWEGKITPKESGTHRFHLKSFGPKRIWIDGKELSFNYTSVEFYTEEIELEAGRSYDIKYEIENYTYGAVRAKMFWKTPAIHALEAEVEERVTTRDVYLPKSVDWIDFWTGKEFDGGQTLVADAPMDILPLYVKAGTILPMGPFLQHATEKVADPIELRIYPGADASFVLYEDENDGYNYEDGVFSTIEFKWNDKAQKLTVEDRQGEFPGMLKERTFQVVLVSENHGVGLQIEVEADKVVQYSGKRLVVDLN